MTWKPNVTVAAIIESAERFLLVEEGDPTESVFNQPAGHLEEGESLIDAVVREVLEETGYRFTPRALVGTYLWKVPTSGRTYLRFTISGSVPDQPETLDLDPDIIATHWMSHDQMLTHRNRLRSPLVLESLDDYLAGRLHSLDLLRAIP